jgi:hypothetical protein
MEQDSASWYYTVYCTTCIPNGRQYIGVHKTQNLDDGYLGSGLVLKRALKKYGVDAFQKEIIGIFDTAEQMFDMEAQLVCEATLPDLYNLKCGGHGGFDFINKEGRNIYDGHAEIVRENLRKGWENGGVTLKNRLAADPEFRRRFTEKGTARLMGNKIWLGRTHSAEAKAKISEAAKKRTPQQNSQFGTCWVTDGVANQKITKAMLEPFLLANSAWRKGRVLAPK